MHGFGSGTFYDASSGLQSALHLSCAHADHRDCGGAGFCVVSLAVEGAGVPQKNAGRFFCAGGRRSSRRGASLSGITVCVRGNRWGNACRKRYYRAVCQSGGDLHRGRNTAVFLRLCGKAFLSGGVLLWNDLLCACRTLAKVRRTGGKGQERETHIRTGVAESVPAFVLCSTISDYGGLHE